MKTRAVIIDGKNWQGVRTSVSVHRVLYELLVHHYSSSCHPERIANSVIRAWIQDGFDSWEVTREIACTIGRPSLVKKLEEQGEIQVDIEDCLK